MTVRIVAGLAEQHRGRPRAAGTTGVGVVAGPAEPAEVLDRAIAGVAQCGRALPQVDERVLADRATAPVLRRQRWTALDQPIRFDTERVAPRAADGRMTARSRAAQALLVRTEVTEVVARVEPDPVVAAARGERIDLREQREQVVGLEQQLRLVGRA